MPTETNTTAPSHGHVLADLLPIVREISAVLDPEALLPIIARQLKRIVDFRILDIFLPDAKGVLVPAFVEGYDPESVSARRRIQPGEGVVGRAAEQREPLFVPDVTADPRYIESFPGVRAEMAIPLVHRDRLVGLLNVETADADALHPEARMALLVLAGHLAVAVENATLYREAQRYAGLLATLYDISKETASILDLDRLLQRIAEVVKRVIDYEMFGILLLEPGSQELVLRKAVRYGTMGEKTHIRLGEGLCGAAALSKQPILVGDVRQDARYIALIPETRSELVVPLVHKDKLIGVFDLESPALDRFNEEHLKVLTPLASQVAIAIENARLYETIVHGEERVRRELALAQWVQRSMLPEESPSGPGWEAAARFLPALELGGDLYDFYEIGEGIVGVSLGDVSGKGVPAALLAAFASGTVRARAFERRAPGDLLLRVNRTLMRRGVEGFFCTLTYALFDFTARTMVLANSGLPYPLLYRTKTGRCASLELPGLPLGTFPQSTYEEREVALEPGDVIVFHTDGLTEAVGDAGDYGVARLVSAVERHAALGADDLSDRILEDVDGFVGGRPRADDLTLVVVKVR